MKSLDLSMLLNDTANGRKKKNCKYLRKIRKSVQTFYAKEVCPTFCDRPLLKALFFEFSSSPFSLTTAMQIFRFDMVNSK